MSVVLLLVHELSAVFLLGAITHQLIALWWRPRPASPGWWQSLRSVHSDRYVTAVVVLFASTFLLGALLYPPFRVAVRFDYLDQHAPRMTGLFELKEHAAALGLALLPAYWRAWREPAGKGPRRAFTTALALVTWWNFMVGHLVNNARGL